MICSNCQTPNENAFVFCGNCGSPLTAPNTSPLDLPATQFLPRDNAPPPPPTVNAQSASSSVETRISPPGNQQGYSPQQNFIPPQAAAGVPNFLNEQKAKKTNNGLILAGAALLLLLAAGAGAIYFFNKQSFSAEALPDHLGMFAQSKEKNKVEEIKKHDFSDALKGRDDLLKDDSLTSVEGNPNLILYSDVKDVSLNDLKLVQLDTMKDDGSLKQLSFQAAPVEGKPEMKRIRIPAGLANGKYAFALFDGYFDEGKHKFWAFQVKNATKSSNDDALQSATVSLKPKQATPLPTPETTATPPQTNTLTNTQPTKPPPPREGTLAYCTSDDVFFRSGPSQSSAPIGKLYRGQRLYVLGYSSNYEYFKDYYSNFARVETADGQRGWVYAVYVK